MRGVSFFSHHVSSFLCEVAYSNKRSEDSDGIKAKKFFWRHIQLKRGRRIAQVHKDTYFQIINFKQFAYLSSFCFVTLIEFMIIISCLLTVSSYNNKTRNQYVLVFICRISSHFIGITRLRSIRINSDI